MKNSKIEKLASILVNIGYENEIALINSEKEAMAKEANAMLSKAWKTVKRNGSKYWDNVTGSKVKDLQKIKAGATDHLKNQLEARRNLVAAGYNPTETIEDITSLYKPTFKRLNKGIATATQSRDFTRIMTGGGVALGGIGVAGTAMSNKK